MQWWCGRRGVVRLPPIPIICPETIFVLTAKIYFEEIGRVLGLFLDCHDNYFCQARDRKVGKLGLDIKLKKLSV
ncbi:MAG: hypothetical protein QMD03_04395, partial [Syntrophales bacterium]|nr:hypothetical protein [Syntrophales bacterium]